MAAGPPGSGCPSPPRTGGLVHLVDGTGWVLANRSVCPAAVVTTAGTPASPVLVPACCQADQVPPDSSVTDSVPLRLTQATSNSAPPVLNGTGELAQPPPIAVHGVQLVLAFAAVCLAVRTVPAEVVTKTADRAARLATAAGSPLTLPGEPVPIAPPHSQSFGSRSAARHARPSRCG